MAINKITPRQLDKASDYKLVPSTALIDAVNVVYADSEGDDDGGNNGVVKNLKGNSAIEFHTPKDVISDGDHKIIGTVVDEKLKLVYFFVFHEVASENGVWVYDPYGRLSLSVQYAIDLRSQFLIEENDYDGVDPYAKHKIKLVAKGSFFNFSQNSVVQGNIVYSQNTTLPNNSFLTISDGIQRDTYEKGVHLYFTDNIQEPKRIDVIGSMMSKDISISSPVTSEACLYDLDGDGIVGQGDIDILLTYIGEEVGLVPELAPYDINGDGTIGQNDILEATAYFGQYCTQNFVNVEGSFTTASGSKFSLPVTAMDEVLFSYACRPTPLVRPYFNFVSDPERSKSNFGDAGGFQFAYQYVFYDGSESTISRYSDIAFPPSVLNQGNDKSPDHASYNVCNIRIPITYGDYSEAWKYISSVRILAKEGQAGKMFIIDEIEPKDNYSVYESIMSGEQVASIVYPFYNDVAAAGVPESEVNKFFDSVPQKAEAQSVVDNRLIYGNYVEGYDNVNTDCRIEVFSDDRPAEFINVDFEIKPSVSIIGKDDYQTPIVSNSVVTNKATGFTVDLSGFPDTLKKGDKVSFSVTMKPVNNYHLYNTENNSSPNSDGDSFHATRQVGNSIADNKTFAQLNWANATTTGSNFLNPILGSSTQGDSAYHNKIQSTSFRAFGKTPGVGKVTWKATYGPNMGSSIDLKLGTSASHPYIVQGRPITFSFDVECITNSMSTGGARSNMRNLLLNILTKRQWGYEQSFGFSIQSRNIAPTIEQDLSINDFQAIPQGNDFSDLICMASGALLLNGSAAPTDRCRATFIPKKQSVEFFLEAVDRTTTEWISDNGTTTWAEAQDPESNGNIIEFRLGIRRISAVELWTAIRKWKEGSPWIVVSPDTMQEYFTNQNWSQFFSLANQDSDSNDPFNLEDWIDNSTLNFHLAAEYIGWTGTGTTVDELQLQPNDTAGWITQFLPGITDEAPGGLITPGATVNPEAYNFSRAMNMAIGFANTVDLYVNDIDTRYLQQSFLSSIGIAPTSPPPGIFEFSLMDGEVGIGGTFGTGTDPSDLVTMSTNSSALGISAYYGGQISDGARLYRRTFLGPYFTGNILLGYWVYNGIADQSSIKTTFGIGGTVGQYDNGFGLEIRSCMPHIQGTVDAGLATGNFITNGQSVVSNSKYSLANNYNGGAESNVDVTFESNTGTLEFLTEPRLDVYPTTFFNARSFKSSAFHDLGIIYFDKLGRRSFVNRIGNFYAPGYSNQERGSVANKGRTYIGVSLNHRPPSWASKYCLAYAPNSSVDYFLQYSTSNAFTRPQPAVYPIIEGNIYVPLHYLQDSDISHAKEFGARGEDNSITRYKFSPGDKLRIISYGKADNRVYPYNVEFEIIEMKTLLENNTSTGYENPLGDTAGTGKKFLGEYLVLRNNPDAEGFSYTSVADGGSFWDQNVLFELYSPKKRTTYDDQIYYEVGDTYPINGTTVKTHSVDYIECTEGDVFFRGTAVNLNEEDGSTFTPLIGEVDNAGDNQAEEKSNFKVVFTESHSASDLFPSKIQELGRPNVILENSKRVRREAGLIYSEKSNPEGRRLNYSSFNAVKFPFKDLEEVFGNINCLINYEGNLLVLQQDRLSMVPVSANILSDVMGNDSLISSKEVLGKERVYSTRAGCDNNPESVVKVDQEVYFAHKSMGKVFRFTAGNGVEEISDVEMGAYFRKMFYDLQEASGRADKRDVRIVGGYDPVKSEYLITLLRPSTLDSSSGVAGAIVYGCTDPTAVNYNPNATFNNGSCYYDDQQGPCTVIGSISSTYTNGNLLDFGPVIPNTVYNSNTIIGSPIKFNNSGECDVVILGIEKTDPYNIITTQISNAVVPGGGSSNLVISVNATAGSVAEISAMAGVYNASVKIVFDNNAGISEFNIPITMNIIDDNADSPTGVITVNIYLGGQLINQEFATNQNGVWTVTVNQDNIIQSVHNSYTGTPENFPSGRSARLEMEVIVSNTLGAEIGPEDTLIINGSITDGSPYLNFISLD